MKSLLLALITLFSINAFSQAKVMNPGLAFGQLVVITVEDVEQNSTKYKSLYALSIPVFAELPMELAVVAGAITLQQQNLLSHVQIKSMARKTPNLDISSLENGLSNELFQGISDGDWIRMELGVDGSISIEKSSQLEAEKFARSRTPVKVELKANLDENRLFRSEDLGWQNFDLVGSKAANYAELAKALNTPERTVVKTGYAIPFFYYQQFVNENSEIANAIQKILRDPLMKRLDAVTYREEKLKYIQDLFYSDSTQVNPELVDQLIALFDEKQDDKGIPLRMKLRSSTNSEDLPNFNGAGLYTSESYKPEKKGKEKSHQKKQKEVIEALKIVWASVWNLRAYEERQHFNIPHKEVKMGIQVNPSFSNELVDGVIVTTNAANNPDAQGAGVYIEAQRGDEYSVANPDPGIQPDRIFVAIDRNDPLNKSLYSIKVLQRSNIADDNKTILTEPNPTLTMTDEEILDLVYQCLKAEQHFKPLLGSTDERFALDLEFKVSPNKNRQRQVYLKQARPYIH